MRELYLFIYIDWLLNFNFYFVVHTQTFRPTERKIKNLLLLFIGNALVQMDFFSSMMWCVYEGKKYEIIKINITTIEGIHVIGDLYNNNKW